MKTYVLKYNVDKKIKRSLINLNTLKNVRPSNDKWYSICSNRCGIIYETITIKKALADPPGAPPSH